MSYRMYYIFSFFNEFYDQHVQRGFEKSFCIYDSFKVLKRKVLWDFSNFYSYLQVDRWPYHGRGQPVSPHVLKRLSAHCSLWQYSKNFLQCFKIMFQPTPYQIVLHSDFIISNPDIMLMRGICSMDEWIINEKSYNFCFRSQPIATWSAKT